MKKIFVLVSFSILLCIISFGQTDNTDSFKKPVTYHLYGGFTMFENRMKDSGGYQGDEFIGESLVKNNFLQANLGVDFELKKLEMLQFGVFVAHNGGDDLSDSYSAFKPITFFGLRTKFYFLPKTIRNNIGETFRVYATGKAALGKERSNYSAINDRTSTSIGLGTAVYPFKKVKKMGFYVDYDYSWFDQKILNQHFLHFGICFN